MRVAAALAAVVLLTGCSGDEPVERAERPGSTASATPLAERATAVLDGVELDLEVADEQPEQAVGLMRRTEVPPGTGMVFLYDRPVDFRFYMYDVPVPLRAVFVREGRVVGSVLMPPCPEREPGDCPTYGPDEPYDTVVETAPETLPDVQPGDRLEPAQPGRQGPAS